MDLQTLSEYQTLFYARRYFGHKIPVIFKEWNRAMIAIVGRPIRKRK